MRKQSRIKTRIDRNVAYFRTLGLKRGECRIDIIRTAARKRAQEVSSRSHPATIDLHRAEIAVAAYRLLDPRGRADLYERVQLSCPLDQEDTAPPPVNRVSSINRTLGKPAEEIPAPKRSSKRKSSKSKSAEASVTLMGREVVDEAIEQTVDPDASDEDLGATTADSQLTLAERRSLVQLLKETEEPSQRAMSPLGWLRARLGI